MNSRKEMIRAGREYYNELFEKYGSNNKETWKAINVIIKNKVVFIKRKKQ